MPSRTGPVASSGAVVGDKRNAIYVEILGSAFFGSINYERRTAYNFCLRIGVTPFASRDVVALIIPITVTKLLGTDGPWPELGFGATFFGAVFRREPDGQFAALFGGSGDSVFSIYRKQPFFHAFVGYRWAPPATENAVVRLGITPLFFHEEYPKVWRLHWWGGLSIGRAF
jgi:hypothetical protein